MATKYDSIGLRCAELRKPDPRIAAAISNALGEAETVLNVGAGTGSYEPVDRRVTAVEPSLEMIRQRSSSAPQAIQASADHLPFDDNVFDAAMAILTVHHWPDKEAGLREMRRVIADASPKEFAVLQPADCGKIGEAISHCRVIDRSPPGRALEMVGLPETLMNLGT